MSKKRTSKKDMPVVILCGGQGTRLREETEYRPKPMVEIGERPILWHIMKVYGHYDLERFVLCLGYKGWVIKQYFLRLHEMLRDFTVPMDGTDGPVFHNNVGEERWRVTCAETGADTATGARLKLVQSYIDTDTFLFTYGDAVAAIDIDKLLEFHWDQGRIATVTGIHPTSRYGEMLVEEGRVVEFNEKPTVAEGAVSGGFFVFQREVFDYMNDDPGTRWTPTGTTWRSTRPGKKKTHPGESGSRASAHPGLEGLKRPASVPAEAPLWWWWESVRVAPVWGSARSKKNPGVGTGPALRGAPGGGQPSVVGRDALAESTPRQGQPGRTLGRQVETASS
jgi:glucose-1-phosphate cytidylyltransferase